MVPLKLWIYRQMEYNADAFARTSGYGRGMAKFVTLSQSSLLITRLSHIFEWLRMHYPSNERRAEKLL